MTATGLEPTTTYTLIFQCASGCLSGCGFHLHTLQVPICTLPVPVTKLRFAHVLSKEFLDIQATIECGFTLKRVRDMIKTYNLQYVFQRVNKTINVLYKLQKKLSGAPLVRFHIMLQLRLFEGFLFETFGGEDWNGG